MSVRNQSTVSSVRMRMFMMSLFIAVVTGVMLLVMGGGMLAAGGTFLAACVSALVCSHITGGVVDEIREEQLSVVESLNLTEDVTAIRNEPDALRAIASFDSIIIRTVESRRKERQQLLDQIVLSEEQLTRIIRNMITGDDREVAQVQDAVTAMENMKNAFSMLIVEIDELSGRSEERAAISAQMSSTTDAIAENINQYSTFVLETSSSIEEMARAAKETADNIRGLAISTEQTASAIMEISASQSNIRENAGRGAAESGNVRDLAQQGLESMAAMLRAMQEIVRSSDESFASINRLSRFSVRVGEILTIIQEVVEQTNLLSLNASIIAAQAGERGKAFAVVAEEVRSLAHRTSSSTREIEELVRNIQAETAAVHRSIAQGRDRVNDGVKMSSRAHDVLATIDRSSEEASRLVAHIATETTEQSIGIQRITEESEKNLDRVRQITIATEQQQEGSNQIIKNLEHLRELAHRINSSAQEQAKGSRLYLRSVMEDNERTKDLKEDAARQISAVETAVDAVQKVHELIDSNAADSVRIVDGVKSLTLLIDRYRTGAAAKSASDVSSNE